MDQCNLKVTFIFWPVNWIRFGWQLLENPLRGNWAISKSLNNVDGFEKQFLISSSYFDLVDLVVTKSVLLKCSHFSQTTYEIGVSITQWGLSNAWVRFVKCSSKPWWYWIHNALYWNKWNSSQFDSNINLNVKFVLHSNC